MKPDANIVAWLLDKDIRAKNAASFLVALFAVAAIYSFSRDAQWFADIDQRGNTAVGVALLVVFLIAFFIVWLVWTGIASIHHKQVKRQQAQAARDFREEQILETLNDLTGRQRALESAKPGRAMSSAMSHWASGTAFQSASRERSDGVPLIAPPTS